MVFEGCVAVANNFKTFNIESLELNVNIVSFPRIYGAVDFLY